MPLFQPRDPGYADRVAWSFRNECASSPWGGELKSIAPGVVQITLGSGGDLPSAPGVLHRSVVAALLDDACALAALSLSSVADAVATAEYKLNFLAPALGDTILACAQVVRPGRTVTVCRADALIDGRLVAKMLATLAISRPA